MNDLERLRREYASREQRLAGSDIYSPLNRSYLFAVQQRQLHTVALLRSLGITSLATKRILELGCGKGGVLLEYLSLGALPEKLFGVDLLLDRIGIARKTLPSIGISCGEGQYLPFPERGFDIVLQYTVFSSILDPEIRKNLAREMRRVLKPDGVIIWYDFWLNPTNSHTHGIGLGEIRSLFQGCKFITKKITLAPPITRRLASISWAGCGLLESLKIFNTHYLVGIKMCQEQS